jgi:hypothetical protein
MFDPAKRLGEKKGGPAMVIALGTSKPAAKYDPGKRLGESEEEEEESTANPDKIMADCSVGICKALNVSESAAPKLRELMEAFHRALDSKVEAEEGDEGEGPMTEDSEKE